MINLLSCGFFSFPKSAERENQDSALPPKKIGNGYLMAIADGVGSYFGADKASKAAIEFLSNINIPSEAIEVEKTLKSIKEKVSDLSTNSESFREAATTLTFCYAGESGLQVGHIGDCRIYFRRGDKLIQVTKDHTQYQKLLDEGIYKASELKGSPTRNTLVTAISKNISMQFQDTYIPYEEISSNDGVIDIFIMSDGAHHFWEQRPRFSINTLSNPNRFASSLHKRIERFQPVDDHTLIAAKFNLKNPDS